MQTHTQYTQLLYKKTTIYASVLRINVLLIIIKELGTWQIRIIYKERKRCGGFD